MFLIEDRKMVRRTFKKFRDQYKRGIFVLHYDNTIHKYYFRRVGRHTAENFLNNSSVGFKQTLKAMIRCLFCGPIKFAFSREGKIEEFLITYRRYIKVFSEQEQTVMTFGCSGEQMSIAENFKKNYCTFFSQYIYDVNRERHLVTEKYIQNQVNWIEDDTIYSDFVDWIFSHYADYAVEVNSSDIELISATDLMEKVQSANGESLNRLLTDVYSGLDKLKEISLPVIDNHNDIKPDNILYDGEQFYLIDYEMFRKNVICFDIVMYVLISAFRYNDNRALLAYLNGRYDDALQRCLLHYGIPFDEHCRNELLFLAILFGINNSIDQFSNVNINMWQKMLRELTDILQSELTSSCD